jgi:hypothetical protein
MNSLGSPDRHAAVGPLAERQLSLWQAVFEFSNAMPGPWTLIGGLMTSVLIAEHAGLDGPIARVTKDADFVADIRVSQRAIRDAVSTLNGIGFEVSEHSLPMGMGHRFIRDGIVVDLLAPDNTGKRSNIRTVGSALTFEAPGTTYALQRTSLISIDTGSQSGVINCPDLAGGLVAKSAAAARDSNPIRHLVDVAMLLAVCPDRFELREQLRAGDIRRLSSIVPKLGEAWPALDASHAAAGVECLRYVLNGSS